MSDTKDHSIAEEGGKPQSGGVLVSFYRSVLFQMIIVGLAAFCTTGIFGSILDIGGGGQAAPWVWNTTNSALFSIMTFTCILGGPLANRIGLRTVLFLGAAGYCPYVASLYVNSKYGTDWFMVFGSIICGIGAGFLFAAEGAIVMGYPEKALLGRYLSIWVSFRNMGGVVGAAVSLGLNVSNNQSGSVTNSTYIALTAISACAAPFVLFLSHPDKVRRADGSKIVFAPKLSWGDEYQRLWKAFATKRVLLLIPCFWSSYFGFSYSGNFQSLYFSVRSRALAGFLAQWAAIAGSLMLGAFLDRTKISRSTRAKLGFYLVIALGITLWVWAMVLQVLYDRNTPDLDWTDKYWARGFLWLMFYQVFQQMFQNYLYWLIPAFNYNMQTIAVEAGLLRGFEAAGEALAFGVGGLDTTMWLGLGLNVGFVAISFITLSFVVPTVPDHDPDEIEGGATGTLEFEHNSDVIKTELAMGLRD